MKYLLNNPIPNANSVFLHNFKDVSKPIYKLLMEGVKNTHGGSINLMTFGCNMGWMKFWNCVKIHCLHWEWDYLIDISNRNKILTVFVLLNERFSHYRRADRKNVHYRLVNKIGNLSLINVFYGSFGRYWLVLLKNIVNNNFSLYCKILLTNR